MHRIRHFFASHAVASVLGLTAVVGLNACDSNDPEPPRATLQFVNAHPDAASDEATLKVEGTTVFNNQVFKTSSKQFVAPGTTANTVSVFASDANDPDATEEVTFERNKTYRFIFTKRGADAGLIYFVDTVTAPTNGNVKLRLVNAAPAAGVVDVYLTAADDDIATATPVAEDVAYEKASQYIGYPAGTRRLRLTAANTKTVVLDVATVTLTSGQITTIVVLDAATGGTPLQWLSLNDRGF